MTGKVKNCYCPLKKNLKKNKKLKRFFLNEYMGASLIAL
jgi:hypothetical protein